MNVHREEYQRMIEKAGRLGFENEMNYWGCSQAVVSALIEAFGIGGPDILRASTGLAGGIARRGHVCGALVGGLMMIGLLTGRDDMEILDQYQRGQFYADILYKRFQERLGSTLCSDIQKSRFGRSFDLTTQEGRDVFINAGAHSAEGCTVVTSEGALLAAKLMVEILEEGRTMARMVMRI